MASNDAWAKVHESACSDARLSSTDFRVFVAVKIRAGEGGSCWESLETIAGRAGGISKKSVQRSLSVLRQHGYLDQVADRNKKVGRRLVVPPAVPRLAAAIEVPAPLPAGPK